MADPATERNRDDAGEARSRDDLYALIDKIGVAMLTTRRADGALVARPMQTQAEHARDGIWFVTSSETHKVEDLDAHPEVNVAYYDSGSREWVSIAGTCTASHERARITAAYKPEWKAWLGDEGGERDGGPDDPRITLLDVHVREATYFRATDSRPIALIKVAAAIVTGEPPRLGRLGHVERSV